MVHWLNIPLHHLAASYHRGAGRIFYWLGRGHRARRHFEQVLLLRGDDFAAYLYLGKLAYYSGDLAGCQREFRYARRTNPERYAQLEHPLELLDAAQGSMQAETGERATWRAFRLSSVGGSEDEAMCDRGISGCPGGDLRRYGDDFSSADERRRFTNLPPISFADVQRVDIDELSRAL